MLKFTSATANKIQPPGRKRVILKKKDLAKPDSRNRTFDPAVDVAVKPPFDLGGTSVGGEKRR